MNSATIKQSYHVLQQGQEGRVTMQGIAFKRFIHRVIREYGTYRDNSYSIDVRNLDMCDKRLALSHYESAEWYEWACESPVRIQEVFKEHVDHMQVFADQESNEVYRDDMEERGMIADKDRDNDEMNWVRR